MKKGEAVVYVKHAGAYNHSFPTTLEAIREAGSVNEMVFKQKPWSPVEKIVVEYKDERGTMKTVTFDAQLEAWKEQGVRVEVTWKKGFEDFTGYGARTNGRKARFYIGRSTGWIPIYLQIDNKRSMGGGAILISAIETIKPLKEVRRWA